MQLQRFRGLLFVVMVVLALIAASPAVEQLLAVPQTTFLTEFGILDEARSGLYPSNVSAGENNRLYLEITNRLGSSAYYVIELKFGSHGQSLPDGFRHTNSDLPAITRFTTVVADNQTVESPLDFAFTYSANAAGDTLEVKSITLNGVTIDLAETTIQWDSQKQGFFGYLFFELWIRNDTTGIMQYHERFTGLWLKMIT